MCTCMLMYTNMRSQTRTPTQAQEQAGTQIYLHKRSHTNAFTQCNHTMQTDHQRRSHFSLIVCAYECFLHVVLPQTSGCRYAHFSFRLFLSFTFSSSFHYCSFYATLPCRHSSGIILLLLGTPRLISNTIPICKHTRRTQRICAYTQTCVHHTCA